MYPVNEVNVEAKHDPISIFTADLSSLEMKMTMRDFVSLATVFKEISSEQIDESPVEMLCILRLLYHASLGLTEPIENSEMLYERYQQIYTNSESPDFEHITHIIDSLHKNNWLSKQPGQLQLLHRGQRMFTALTRLANDSLSVYQQNDIERSLFQALREAQIREAYDNQGISGETPLTSIVRHVEEAVEKLEERQLKFLADTNGLPHIEAIHHKMLEVEAILSKQFANYQTNSTPGIRQLIHRGKAILQKGTALSSNMLTKYIRFTSMQDTSKETVISPEKIQTFILNMYSSPTDSTTPNAHDILSFMEQQINETEAMDGLWVPVKFASPIGAYDIQEAIHYLETYEPLVNEPLTDDEEILYVEEEISVDTVENLFEKATWEMTKAIIDTNEIETYLEDNGEADLEELMIESSSSNWGDAIRSLLAVSALSNIRKVDVKKKDNPKKFNKEWEWIEDDDRYFSIEQRPTKR